MDWYALVVTVFGLVPLLGAMGFVLMLAAFFLAIMFLVGATGIVLIVRDGNWILGSILIVGQVAFDLLICRSWLTEDRQQRS